MGKKTKQPERYWALGTDADGKRRISMGNGRMVIDVEPIPSTCSYCDGPSRLYSDPLPVGTAICPCCSFEGCTHRPQTVTEALS